MMRCMPACLSTISDAFRATVARRGGESALGYIRGGELRWLTWEELLETSSRLAAALRAAGIEPGDRVAQVSENRYEWIVTDLALHLAGAVHVPIHVTLSGEQIAEQIIDSESRFVFVSSRALLATFADRLPDGIPIQVHEEQPPDRQPPALPAVLIKQPANEIEPPAEPGADGRLEQHCDRASARDRTSANQKSPAESLATILYTSGTTGRPRGVMLTHGNLASNAAAVVEAFDREDETRLCVLPLSHIYARTCDLYTWVFRGSRLVLAESRDTLARDLQLARPTALNSVPFLYQRVADRIREAGGDERKNLRDYFGGRVDMLNSGGAPLSPEVEAWYADHGMPVLVGYGLTETSPVVSISTTDAHRAGSVGRVLPGVDVRIAEDGEILVRGPNVMAGLWRNPEATAEMIVDGWFHTGDLGSLDDDGFLFIRGRKKELIVLSTGKKVVPTRVELLLAASPLIEQAAVFGDGQCGLVALIVPAANGSPVSSECAEKRAQYEVEIKRCLMNAAHEEQVHRFHLVDRPFSIERGEMTGKLSLCRAAITRNFAAELERLAAHHQ